MQYLDYSSCLDTCEKSKPKSLSILAKYLCSETSDYLSYFKQTERIFIF